MLRTFFPFQSPRLVMILIFGTSFLPSTLHAQDKPGTKLIIPIGGNTWSNNPNGGKVDNQGIIDWTSQQTWFSTYVRVSFPVNAAGNSQTVYGDSLQLWLKLSVPRKKPD